MINPTYAQSCFKPNFWLYRIIALELVEVTERDSFLSAATL